MLFLSAFEPLSHERDAKLPGFDAGVDEQLAGEKGLKIVYSLAR
jgi:hypothetical protein